MSFLKKYFKIIGITAALFFSNTLFAAIPLQTLKVMVVSEDNDTRVGFSIDGSGAAGVEATTEGNNLTLMSPKNGFSQNPIQVSVFADNGQVCQLNFSCKSVFGKECFNETMAIKNKLPGNDVYQYLSWNGKTDEINVTIHLKGKEASEYYCSME